MSRPHMVKQAPPTPPASSDADKPGKTGARRQAEWRQRQLAAGKRQFSFWLDDDEAGKVRTFLSQESPGEADAIVRERDKLQEQLWKSRTQVIDLLDDVRARNDEILEHLKTINELKSQLRQAERALKEKPAKTFHVAPLPDRRKVVASALSTDGWTNKEKDPGGLKARAELAKKFSTDIKNARSRLLSFAEVAHGVKLLEQSKSQFVSSGSWQKFPCPIISEAEKALLLEACALLGRIGQDVEGAGSDVSRLQKQREAEHAERVKQAGAALDMALFNGLDRRGEVLFVAAMHPRGQGYGSWSDLVDAASGGSDLYEPALAVFKKALKEEKNSLIGRVAETMRHEGKTAEELTQGIVDKYRHADTEEKFGDIANKVTTFLVADQLARS